MVEALRYNIYFNSSVITINSTNKTQLAINIQLNNMIKKGN